MTRQGVPDTSGACGMPPEYSDDLPEGPATSDALERASAARSAARRAEEVRAAEVVAAGLRVAAATSVGRVVGEAMTGPDDRESSSIETESIKIHANVDPDGRFVSLEYTDTNGRRATVGVMQPGTHEFTTASDTTEYIFVVDGGSMGVEYKQKGGKDPEQVDIIRPGESKILTKDSHPMTIPPNTKFTITVVGAPVGYRSVLTLPEKSTKPDCRC